MFTYIARRVVGTIPVIVLISLLVFMLVQAAPGDPADLLLSDEASKEDIDEARKRWGLDQPVYIQYGKFFIAAVQGDLVTIRRSGWADTDPTRGATLAARRAMTAAASTGTTADGC